MVLILNVETTNKNCSISLAKNGKPFLIMEEYSEYYSHAEQIHCFIVHSIECNLLKLSEVTAICINKGPGSFTGVKIGLSVAKGLCYGLNKPLLFIDSLTILIEGIYINKGIIISYLETLSQNLYISIYDENKLTITFIQKDTFKVKNFKKELFYKRYILGNVTKRVLFNIKRLGFFFIKRFPSSQDMAFVSYKYMKNIKIMNS